MRLSEYLWTDLERNFQLEVSTEVLPTNAQIYKRLLSPRFVPVLLIRLSHFCARAGLSPLAKAFSMLNYFSFGIEVGLQCEIGPGLYLPHTVGTVIGSSRIGANAIIHQGVTLGAKKLDPRFDPSKRPALEDDVTIGAGAKVLGGLTVGRGATVGANAVVTHDVLPGQTVVGIPARPVRSKEYVLL